MSFFNFYKVTRHRLPPVPTLLYIFSPTRGARTVGRSGLDAIAPFVSYGYFDRTIAAIVPDILAPFIIHILFYVIENI